MRRLVADALDAGAIGFASSRQPAHAGAWGKLVPSRLATTDELMRLAEPLAERGRGTFAITHGPDFGPVELAELSVKTGRHHLDRPERLAGRLPPAGQGGGPRRRGLAPGRLPPDRLPGHPGRAGAVRPR